MIHIPRNRTLFHKVHQLRSKGASYSDIQRASGLAKSTISSWLSNASWSRKIAKRLQAKLKDKNIERLVVMNRARSKQKLVRHEMYRQSAKAEFQELKNNSLFIAGLALYWGEGDKAQNGRVSVINTDPIMLCIIVRFYRKILKSPETKLRAALFVYDDLDSSKMLNYWSKILKIPPEQFIKTQLLTSRSRLTKRKSQFGICSVYFSNTEIRVKIQEWISLLAEEVRR